MKRLFLALMMGFAMRLAGQATARVSSASLAQHRETDATIDQLYSEAQAEKGRGDLEGAIHKYQAILKLVPHLAAACNNLRLLYFQQGNYRDAVSAFEDGSVTTKICLPLSSSWEFLITRWANSRTLARY